MHTSWQGAFRWSMLIATERVRETASVRMRRRLSTPPKQQGWQDASPSCERQGLGWVDKVRGGPKTLDVVWGGPDLVTVFCLQLYRVLVPPEF